jgi:hypothetical protein
MQRHPPVSDQSLGISPCRRSARSPARLPTGSSPALTGGLRARSRLSYVTLPHASIRLDRDFHWIHNRWPYSRALGWRHDLLFWSAAQRGWCVCGTVARVASVKMTETNISAGPPSPSGRLSRARHAEPTAKNRHLLSVQQPGNEFQPFIHRITLLPGHFALLAKGPIV